MIDMVFEVDDLQFPEELTCDELDEYPDVELTTDEGLDEKDFWKKARNFDEYILYTQCDSEISDDVVYVKGNRWVNRTGVYAIIRKNQEEEK